MHMCIHTSVHFSIHMPIHTSMRMPYTRLCQRLCTSLVHVDTCMPAPMSLQMTTRMTPQEKIRAHSLRPASGKQSYQIRVLTGHGGGAGTDACVWLKLFGDMQPPVHLLLEARMEAHARTHAGTLARTHLQACTCVHASGQLRMLTRTNFCRHAYIH